MKNVKFEQNSLKALKAPDKRIELFDHDTPGLGLRVTPTGHKSYFYRYRFGGKIRRFTIGNFSDWKLSDARAKARALKVQVNEGIDPQAIKQKKKNAVDQKSFKELADEFKQIHLQGLRKKTKDEYERIIDNELLPALGKRPAADITRGEIISLLDKKAIADGKKTMANRIRARLHSIYEFGISRGIVENNPVTSVKRYSEGETKRERYYSEKEIQRLWQAFNGQEQPTQTVLKMLLLTGQRSKETRYMKWDDIKGDVWTIPAELAKGKREHDVPLSDFAMQLIESMRPVTGDSDYIFESPKKENQPIEWIKRTVKNIRDSKETKVSDFRLHDLRRTTATYMAKLGVDRTVLGKILNHKGLAGDGQVTAIYDRHSYMREKRQALQKWSNYLRRILSGEEIKIHKIG